MPVSIMSLDLSKKCRISLSVFHFFNQTKLLENEREAIWLLEKQIILVRQNQKNSCWVLLKRTLNQQNVTSGEKCHGQ